MPLRIDFSGLPSDLSKDWSDECLESAFERFQHIANGAESGFFQLPSQRNHLEDCQKFYQRLNQRKNFLHLGVGGSSLGPEMLISALAPSTAPRFEFINNVDPDILALQLKNIDWAETLLYVVSKSGNTPETLASLAAIGNCMDSATLKELCLVATEPGGGKLGQWAQQRGVPRLSLPAEVGGRYSVLTSVGLLPALFAGLNPEKLLEGAASLAPCLLAPLPHNELIQTAASLIALKKRGVNQTVFMPYSGRLRQLGFWFVQLWAESLGKQFNRRGETVHTGLTPIPAWGTTDQHGQMQLFMEGPADKLILLVEVASFETDFEMNHLLPEFNGRNLSEMMGVQLAATKKALSHAGRPWIGLRIENLNEFSLGALILFLESLTVATACLMDIDPFDQPGVEKSKEYARKDWQS